MSLVFFIDKCMEVADSSVVCRGRPTHEPVGGDMGNMYARCGVELFLCVYLFARAFAILLPAISACTLTLWISNFMWGPIQLVHNCRYK